MQWVLLLVFAILLSEFWDAVNCCKVAPTMRRHITSHYPNTRWVKCKRSVQLLKTISFFIIVAPVVTSLIENDPVRTYKCTNWGINTAILLFVTFPTHLEGIWRHLWSHRVIQNMTDSYQSTTGCFNLHRCAPLSSLICRDHLRPRF